MVEASENARVRDESMLNNASIGEEVPPDHDAQHPEPDSKESPGREQPANEVPHQMLTGEQDQYVLQPDQEFHAEIVPAVTTVVPDGLEVPFLRPSNVEVCHPSPSEYPVQPVQASVEVRHPRPAGHQIPHPRPDGHQVRHTKAAGQQVCHPRQPGPRSDSQPINGSPDSPT